MTKNMKYRKRYVRSREPIPFRLTEEDIEILRLLHEYRFLNLKHIQALRPRGVVALRDRLRRMFHAGLVDRPRSQRSYLAPPQPMTYALGNKGADVLAVRGLLVDRGKVDWSKKNGLVSRPYLEHTLMISKLRVALTLALRELGSGAQIIRWVPEGAELNYNFWAGGEHLSIRPDAFFTLENILGRFHFCLEADRSTMTTRRFQQKLLAYWTGRRAYQDWLGINAPFRVLTITVSETRRDNLVKAASDLGEAGQTERFLFACEKDYSLEYPQDILAPIWHCPRDGSLRSIIRK